jgi:cation transport regulator
MPYNSNEELPDPVRNSLPAHAQDIYREAFNSGYESHKEESSGEETAHKIAWSAVKRSYEKREDGKWHKK